MFSQRNATHCIDSVILFYCRFCLALAPGMTASWEKSKSAVYVTLTRRKRLMHASTTDRLHWRPLVDSIGDPTYSRTADEAASLLPASALLSHFENIFTCSLKRAQHSFCFQRNETDELISVEMKLIKFICS